MISLLHKNNNKLALLVEHCIILTPNVKHFTQLLFSMHWVTSTTCALHVLKVNVAILVIILFNWIATCCNMFYFFRRNNSKHYFILTICSIRVLILIPSCFYFISLVTWDELWSYEKRWMDNERNCEKTGWVF